MPPQTNHKVLFEPVRIGPVTAKNRFYQVPHGPNAGNFPNIDQGIKGMRAEGGWGVVCCEICSIHPSSDYNHAGIRRLWNDQHVKENAVTVEAIHKHGALASIELGHYGMVAINYASREPIWGPSAQFALGATGIFPAQVHAIDRRGIRDLLSWQRAAAIRAKRAGFDIVYVYAAHNLALPMHFLSPMYNQRTDEYGGSLENRARLLREMIEVTKDAVGDTCAVAVRLSVDELIGLDGITADREGRQVIELLGELPDLWDVNVSDWSNDSRSSRFAKEGWQETYVRFVKSLTTKPVVGVGRFTSPDTMASQIRRGVLDLIGAARPSIADPFLPRKIEEGRVDDIRECIGCNYCIKTCHFVVAGCTQNPTMGEEWRLGWHPEHIAPKVSDTSILVVGAGPAGLEVTRALAQRGYRVTLAEASGELGGRVRREAALPGLAEWIRVADWRIGQITRLANVTIYKGSEITAADILGLEHEHIVIATGSRWRDDGQGQTNRASLQIEDGARILTPNDLMGGVPVNLGVLSQPIVIFDDDQHYLGSVLAELLCGAGYRVRLVTPGHTVSKYTIESLESAQVLARMRELGVQLSVQKNIKAIHRQAVTIECLLSHETETIAAAAVVLVTARRPLNELYHNLRADQEQLSASGIRSVSLIGDANIPDTIAAAVFSGHRYAREFEGEPIDIARLPASSRTLY